jgi:hypothetical protein
MNKSLLFTMYCILAIALSTTAAVLLVPNTSETFTTEECTTVPTGRTQKTVTVVRDEQGQPKSVNEHIVGLEYATLCQRTEWRQ